MRRVEAVVCVSLFATVLSFAENPSPKIEDQNATRPLANADSGIPPVFWPSLFAAIAATLSCFAAYVNLNTTKQLKRLDVFFKVVDRLENPENRAARRETRKLRQSGVTPVQLIANEEQRRFVDQVCRDFDLIGLLDNANVIDRSLVKRFYAVPFVDLYEPFLKNYIDQLRLVDGENRGPTHFWEVDRLYDRVKHVIHPSKMNPPRLHWPD